MADKEKAELLNGILNYLKDNGNHSDLTGFRNGCNDPTTLKALKGLQTHGYVKLVIAEDKDEVFIVTLTDKGLDFISNSNFI